MPVFARHHAALNAREGRPACSEGFAECVGLNCASCSAIIISSHNCNFMLFLLSVDGVTRGMSTAGPAGTSSVAAEGELLDAAFAAFTLASKIHQLRILWIYLIILVDVCFRVLLWGAACLARIALPAHTWVLLGHHSNTNDIVSPT